MQSVKIGSPAVVINFLVLMVSLFLLKLMAISEYHWSGWCLSFKRSFKRRSLQLWPNWRMRERLISNTRKWSENLSIWTDCTSPISLCVLRSDSFFLLLP